MQGWLSTVEGGAGLGAADGGPGGGAPGAGGCLELCQPSQHCHRQAGDGQVCSGVCPI